MIFKKLTLPTPEEALPGRADAMPVPDTHAVLNTSLKGPFEGMETLMVGMGCFWGAEQIFWRAEGVHSTAVGYAAGHTPNPTYAEVGTGRPGHNEVVRIILDPTKTSCEVLLRLFWESHAPTQGMRQGNDRGTQYRSGVYVYNEAQREVAHQIKEHYQRHLSNAGYGAITTEIIDAPPFYFAESYHQQYLHKNPGGYCGLKSLGVPTTA